MNRIALITSALALSALQVACSTSPESSVSSTKQAIYQQDDELPTENDWIEYSYSNWQTLAPLNPYENDPWRTHRTPREVCNDDCIQMCSYVPPDDIVEFVRCLQSCLRRCPK